MVSSQTRWVASLGLAVGLALSGACGGKKAPAPAPPPPPPPPPVQVAPAPPPPAPRANPPRPTPPPAPATPTEDEIFARTSLDQLNAQQPLADAFFAYDSDALTNDVLVTLQRDATWLRKWTSVRIMIEGHADERGTNEYNLALGERRATAVRKYLTGLGIPDSRIDVVSKGEEAPFCTTHDEDCWYQNRRGHFIITAK